MANCILVSHPDLEKKNPRLKPVSQGMSIRVHLPIYFSLAYTTYPEKSQENFFVLGNVSCEATASLKLITASIVRGGRASKNCVSRQSLEKKVFYPSLVRFTRYVPSEKAKLQIMETLSKLNLSRKRGDKLLLLQKESRQMF